MKTTVKTIAMAAMMLMGTATTFAKTNPGMRHDNNKPATVVVVNNNNHHHDKYAKDHRHMDKPMYNCFCKHCKKMRHDMEVARKRHEAEMRRMEAARHHRHPEVNARTGRAGYVARH